MSGLVGLARLRASDAEGFTFIVATVAFDEAIASGRLSDVQTSPVFAGRFIYMGTKNGRHLFKNSTTREYLP